MFFVRRSHHAVVMCDTKIFARNSHYSVLSPPLGDLAKTQRALAQQRVEEEVCHALQRRHSVLPLQCQRELMCSTALWYAKSSLTHGG